MMRSSRKDKRQFLVVELASAIVDLDPELVADMWAANSAPQLPIVRSDIDVGAAAGGPRIHECAHARTLHMHKGATLQMGTRRKSTCVGAA